MVGGWARVEGRGKVASRRKVVVDFCSKSATDKMKVANRGMEVGRRAGWCVWAVSKGKARVAGIRNGCGKVRWC
jgi:hypothetical protein